MSTRSASSWGASDLETTNKPPLIGDKLAQSRITRRRHRQRQHESRQLRVKGHTTVHCTRDSKLLERMREISFVDEEIRSQHDCSQTSHENDGETSDLYQVDPSCAESSDFSNLVTTQHTPTSRLLQPSIYPHCQTGKHYLLNELELAVAALL